MKTTLQFNLFVSLYLALYLASPAWATGSYHAGDGTADNPFQILTAQQLIDLGRHPEDYDKHFILISDIDIGINAPGGKVFRQAVIAPDSDPVTWEYDGPSFSGTFNGNGYCIKNLTIEYPDRGYLGLFGKIDLVGTVMNLGLENTIINANQAQDCAGCLTGINEGFIIGCYATCSIYDIINSVGGLIGINYGEIIDCHTAGTVGGWERIGGLVGYNSGGFIQKCSSACSTDGAYDTGGLTGYIDQDSLISYSYASGPIDGNTGPDCYTGGLVGFNSFSMIYRCYATGPVWGYYAGGLVGHNINGNIINCYATGSISGTNKGGLIYSGYANDSFWDVNTSGVSEPGVGTGLPTAQMMQQQTFVNAGWDFDTVWTMQESQTYPYFQWQETSSVILCQDGQPYPIGDLNADCIVDLQDYCLFTQHWMEDLRP